MVGKKNVLFSQSTNIILFRESVSLTGLDHEFQLASINNPVNGIAVVAYGRDVYVGV